VTKDEVGLLLDGFRAEIGLLRAEVRDLTHDLDRRLSHAEGVLEALGEAVLRGMEESGGDVPPSLEEQLRASQARTAARRARGG